MTKFKVCSKIHLFIIISVIFITIGMAVGTICHFCANGFFNYGDEFSSYNSVTVTYVSSEFKDDEAVKPVCEGVLKEFKAYEVSSADTSLGGEIVYKFSSRVDAEELRTAVDKLNEELHKDGRTLCYASLHEGVATVGASRVITYASIALASAVAFQFLYYIIRYKLRAAFSAILACIHNLGVFVALAAITRIPVGTETIVIGTAVVFLMMLLTGILFDRTRKNFASDRYLKSDRLEVVDTSACEVRWLTLISLCSLAVAAVVFGVFAAISKLWFGAFSPFAIMLLGLVACAYGAMFFTPAVHGGIDALCEKVKSSRGKKKPAKATKPAKESA